MSDEREVRLEPELALKAALTSWPRVEFVRMERRWRGLNAAVEEGIVMVVAVCCGECWTRMLVGVFKTFSAKCDWRNRLWVLWGRILTGRTIFF